MIDMTKQYTYNGKPVRIYADGIDTTDGYIHCSVQDDNGKWYIPYGDTSESDLVEVWQPVIGEWCYFYQLKINNGQENKTLTVGKYTGEMAPDGRYITEDGFAYYNIAPLTGILPEAFKGLQNGK